MIVIFLLLSLVKTATEETKYKEGDSFNITVGSLRSKKSAVPIDYKYLDLFCLGEVNPLHQHLISESLTGEITYSTPYKIVFGKDQKACGIVCSRKYTETQKNFLISLIDNNYKIYFSHDKLSINHQKSHSISDLNSQIFDIGYVKQGTHYLRNFISFEIQTNDSQIQSIKITEFDNIQNGCKSVKYEQVSLESGEQIDFQFKYKFSDKSHQSPTRKFDTNSVLDDKHYINLLFFTLGMTIITSFILFFRIYKAAFREAKHNDDEIDEYDGCEWKLVHADVCRPPLRSDRISQIVGWGVQLFLAILLSLALVYFRSDLIKNKIDLIDVFVKCYIVSAIIGGFFTGRMFKTIGSSNWKGVVFFSSIALTLLLLLPHFILTLLSSKKSGYHFHLPKSFLLVFANFVIYFIGCMIGLRTSGFQLSQKINLLPRQVPPHSVLYDTPFLSIVSGLIISISTNAHLHNLFHLIWKGESSAQEPVYALFLVFLSGSVISINLGILAVFARLLKEDYRWWWTAFWTGGTSGIFYLAHSLFFCLTEYLPIDGESYIIYVLSNIPVAFAISVINGAISFLGSFFFIRYIYDSLKME